MSFTGVAVSGLILRLKAKELCSDPKFKASLGWYQNWKKRHVISFWTKTTLAQRLPQDLERWQSSSIGSWLQLGNAMAIHYPGFSIWMKPLCDLSFHQAEPLNSVAAEPFQWSPVVPKKELYSDTSSRRWWQQITACSNLQRCSHSARPCCSRLCSCIIPQEGLDGWER